VGYCVSWLFYSWYDLNSKEWRNTLCIQKKDFIENSISELLVECDKITSSLRANELDEDIFHVIRIGFPTSQIYLCWRMQLNHIQEECTHSLKQNLRINFYLVAQCWRPRGQSLHIWLCICSMIMELQLHSTLKIRPLLVIAKNMNLLVHIHILNSHI
jgi:hypothetical protein